MTSWSADALATSNPNIDNLIAGYGVNHQSNPTDKFNVFAPPSYPLIPATGIAQGYFLKHPILPSASQDSKSLLSTIFTTQSDDATEKVLNAILIFNPSIPVITAPVMALTSKCPTNDGNSLNSTDPACVQAKMNLAYANIDAANLLGPLTFQTSAQAQAAKNFITALTESANPLPLYNFPAEAKSSNKDLQVLLNEKKEYLTSVRAFAAAQAFAINNLSQAYAERKPIDMIYLKDHPEQIQAIMELQKSAPEVFKNGLPSPLQLENYMATRRITDPRWYASLVNDTPASLQRQQIMLMAENLAEAHKTRLAIERLNATMSVMILQFSSQNRTVLKNANSSTDKPPTQ